MSLRRADFEAVLLDMDGTLIDSTPAVERSWTDFAARHGLDAGAVLADCHGKPAPETIARWLPWASSDRLAEEAARQHEAECDDLDGITALPGAADFLSYLDAEGIPWLVVTSATARLAAARLGAAGLTAPRLVTPADVERGKPAPDAFLEGARRLGVPIGRCLAVEDSPAGLRSARDAGALVVDVGPGGTSLDAVREELAGG